MLINQTKLNQFFIKSIFLQFDFEVKFNVPTKIKYLNFYDSLIVKKKIFLLIF